MKRLRTFLFPLDGMADYRRLVTKLSPASILYSLAARIRTHILTTRPSEHKSDALNRSATAPPCEVKAMHSKVSCSRTQVPQSRPGFELTFWRLGHQSTKPLGYDTQPFNNVVHSEVLHLGWYKWMLQKRHLRCVWARQFLDGLSLWLPLTHAEAVKETNTKQTNKCTSIARSNQINLKPPSLCQTAGVEINTSPLVRD